MVVGAADGELTTLVDPTVVAEGALTVLTGADEEGAVAY